MTVDLKKVEGEVVLEAIWALVVQGRIDTGKATCQTLRARRSRIYWLALE